MAGRPKTRAKKIAAGECVCPAQGCPIHKNELERAVASDTLPMPGSPEWMRMLTDQRMEAAKTDPAKKGGRPRKPTAKEAEEKALDRMLPKALRVLEEQLDDEDQRVRQKAAIDVINRVKGKAAETVKMTNDATHTIRYESAAWTWGRDVIDGEVVEEEPLELPPGV